MTRLVDWALAYAARGWPIFRLSKAKVPLKGTHGHLDATLNIETIRSWWDVENPPNIGLACGDPFVIDLDGPGALQSPWGSSLLAAAKANGGFPQTLIATTRRGVHLYFTPPDGVVIRSKNEKRSTSGEDGVDIKGRGGYVVLAPSTSRGFTYSWAKGLEPAIAPDWLLAWIEACGAVRSAGPANLPAHLQGRAGAGLASRVGLREPASLDDLDRIRSALDALPADGYDVWYQVGMALYSTGWDRPDGTSLAFDLFDEWSESVPEKYSLGACEAKWQSFGQSGRGEISLGTLFYLAEQAGWVPTSNIVETVPDDQKQFQHLNGTSLPKLNGQHPPGYTNGTAVPELTLQLASNNPDNPLIEFNEKFCVIGNIGGKCMVMEWIPSPAENGLKVPSFQTFKTISERYAHRYINVASEKKTKGGEGEKSEESKQLGPYWLKWNGRRNYEGLDLDPTGPALLPGNILNLWTGYGVKPHTGSWALMQRHVMEVLADGDPACAAYIFRWAAWSVQHAGEPGEVALVFRGGKGVGKGTFGHAVRRLFGQHGLYISHSKHMVGQFNGHLRSTILLLADEAFWAGDKQGQSSLQAMLTEPVLMVENKGVDASQIKNRLHIIMLANAEWVVPASADERRYAVFNVSSRHQRDRTYFERLREELDNGGLEAMLYDLQRVELKGWHPREVIQTTALQQQKAASLNALQDWYAGVLSEAYPPAGRETKVPAAALLHVARESTGKLRDLSPQALGRFLKKHGVKQVHTPNGSAWEFPALKQLRGEWEREFGAWAWESDVEAWRTRV